MTLRLLPVSNKGTDTCDPVHIGIDEHLSPVADHTFQGFSDFKYL